MQTTNVSFSLTRPRILSVDESEDSRRNMLMMTHFNTKGLKTTFNRMIRSDIICFNENSSQQFSENINVQSMRTLTFNNVKIPFSLQFLFAVVGIAFADVSHIVGDTTTTTSYPPRPYQFSYEAGRYPGHVDRKYLKV